MTKKYILTHGIHCNTITSRDSCSQIYNSEQEAREAFADQKAFYKRIGYKIWFAYITTPDGQKITIEPGRPHQ